MNSRPRSQSDSASTATASGRCWHPINAADSLALVIITGLRAPGCRGRRQCYDWQERLHLGAMPERALPGLKT